MNIRSRIMSKTLTEETKITRIVMKNMSLSSKIMVLMLQLDIKIITITIILLKVENPGKKTKAMHNLSVKLRLTWWYLNQSLYKAHHLLPRRFIVMTAKKTH